MGADNLGCFECPTSGEDAQTGEEPLLRVRKEAEAPLDRSAQRLLAGRCRAAATDQQTEPIVQAPRELIEA